MKPIDEFNGMLAQTFLPIFGIEVPEKDGEAEKKKKKEQAAAAQKGPFDDLPFFNMWKGQTGGEEGEGIFMVGMRIQKTVGQGQPANSAKRFEVMSLDPDCEPSKLGVKKGDTLHQVGIIEVKALSEQEVSELVQHTLGLGEKLRLIFKVAEANKASKTAKGTLEILCEDHTRSKAAAGGKEEEGGGAGEYV
eukprot:CAMPEP_0177729028 /NCGR_PEP_ID=MMETSP0484_2-20121128/21202_1 /TAXON_ID=354590 /ORGANISM="Rhodomonas lens, Strain RHODO" /LENGTH=191 /DNA_ID=CAMNT_0019241853 /DNA_START=159 /DNA_END=734 /DNA_ORIENTATION=-